MQIDVECNGIKVSITGNPNANLSESAMMSQALGKIEAWIAAKAAAEAAKETP